MSFNKKIYFFFIVPKFVHEIIHTKPSKENRTLGNNQRVGFQSHPHKMKDTRKRKIRHEHMT